MSLSAELRNTEHLAHFFKSDFRIFILDPHSFCGIDRRTAADGYDPVRLEFFHSRSALHNGLNGGIRLNTFEQLNLHAGFFQVIDCFVEEAEFFHRAAADANHCSLAFKSFQRFQSTLAMI